MLTRLQVTGFKNLVDVDVRFGAFTCIAGTNGVGKSNLFDAIRFLSALADQPLMEAAKSVRGGRTADVKGLFHRVGDRYDNKMSFVAEMIVPDFAFDDLGQKADPSTRFLRYSLELGLRTDDSYLSLGELEILKEELEYIKKGDAEQNLRFPYSQEWRKSVLKGGQQYTKFISTMTSEQNQVVIQLHQNRSGDNGAGGGVARRLASTLPRTVLSVTNAAENRTALVARREMQSWRLLQLEPSALREPDEFVAPSRLGVDGSHLAATLYRLARSKGENYEQDEERVYAQLANRLSRLIDDVRAVNIDRDERRELLTLLVEGRDGTPHSARALSDGTLRFLALAAIDLDPAAQGLLCLEEPENGIHPARIPAMLQLLQDIATDTQEAVGEDNPLRQVIVNTHSPAVVNQVPDDALVVAEVKEGVQDSQRFKKVIFACLDKTWRAKNGDVAENSESTEKLPIVSRGSLMAYLNPNAPAPFEVEYPPKTEKNGATQNGHGKRSKNSALRVMDRPDLQLMLPLALEAAVSERE